MKDKEIIINDSIKNEIPPKDYNLLEIHCFLALKQLLIMFRNKQIGKENATKTKNRILADYDKKCKQYEFEESMFQEHIENIKKTENQRTKLRKRINDKNAKITKAWLQDSLELALDIIYTIFEEEFT